MSRLCTLAAHRSPPGDGTHIVANHTMTHQDLCRKDVDVGAREIDLGKQAIEAATGGFTTAWFRTPYGVRCERVEQLLSDRHLGHFHWDLDPQEWKHGDAAKAVAYVTGELGRASGRDVLLMHDIKQATVKALPEILAWLDAENARRARSHKQPIRVLQAPALAVERLPKGLVAWLGDATAGARALPDAIASVLP